MHLPNVPAKAFSLSAVIVGYLLIDDLTANEQNALGNWLMLTAQVLMLFINKYKLIEVIVRIIILIRKILLISWKK